ncbi:MAG TPA: hypothetical protein VGN77_00680, partial [Steroidobacteraceae bacterium]|nr:hypothetical protein [Steroidobacteraceae bacterium]
MHRVSRWLIRNQAASHIDIGDFAHPALTTVGWGNRTVHCYCRSRLSIAPPAALTLASGPNFAVASADPSWNADLKAIDGAESLRHIQILSADELEGAPSTLGERRAVEDFKQKFAALGVQPSRPDGSYTQVDAYALAESKHIPHWYPDSEFKAT